MALRKSEVDKLYTTIMQLTYPDMYNDDGSMKTFDDVESVMEDKKKA